jgi:hypothetical protein
LPLPGAPAMSRTGRLSLLQLLLLRLAETAALFLHLTFIGGA